MNNKDLGGYKPWIDDAYADMISNEDCSAFDFIILHKYNMYAADYVQKHGSLASNIHEILAI